jgi:hypothetical protein
MTNDNYFLVGCGSRAFLALMGILNADNGEDVCGILIINKIF